MFRHMVLTGAASLALGFVPMLAAAQQPPQGETPAMQQEVPDGAMAPDATAPGTMAPDAKAPEAMTPSPLPEAAMAPDEGAAQPRLTFVMNQLQGQWLASELIGQKVTGEDGDTLGEIADLLVGVDNRAEAIVLSVGGFLGIGARSVAVSIEGLRRVDDGDGGQSLVLADATREKLESAPEFLTQAAQAEAVRQRAREEGVRDDNAAVQPLPPEGGAQ